MHISLPEELLAVVDKIAGKRKRNRFVESAVKEKLFREILSALEESAGVIDLASYPKWQSPEKISEWVHNRRRGVDTGLFE